MHTRSQSREQIVYTIVEPNHRMVTRSQSPVVDNNHNMVTRSQRTNDTYEVDINFDEASTAWRSNKKSVGNGQFEYISSRTRSSTK
jgi:hypothetical protein